MDNEVPIDVNMQQVQPNTLSVSPLPPLGRRTSIAEAGSRRTSLGESLSPPTRDSRRGSLVIDANRSTRTSLVDNPDDPSYGLPRRESLGSRRSSQEQAAMARRDSSHLRLEGENKAAAVVESIEKHAISDGVAEATRVLSLVREGCTAENTISSIRELQSLQEKGVLTPKAFESAKREILELARVVIAPETFGILSKDTETEVRVVPVNCQTPTGEGPELTYEDTPETGTSSPPLPASIENKPKKEKVKVNFDDALDELSTPQPPKDVLEQRKAVVVSKEEIPASKEKAKAAGGCCVVM